MVSRPAQSLGRRKPSKCTYFSKCQPARLAAVRAGGVVINRKRLRWLMSEAGIAAVAPKRWTGPAAGVACEVSVFAAGVESGSGRPSPSAPTFASLCSLCGLPDGEQSALCIDSYINQHQKGPCLPCGGGGLRLHRRAHRALDEGAHHRQLHQQQVPRRWA